MPADGEVGGVHPLEGRRFADVEARLPRKARLDGRAVGRLGVVEIGDFPRADAHPGVLRGSVERAYRRLDHVMHAVRVVRGDKWKLDDLDAPPLREILLEPAKRRDLVGGIAFGAPALQRGARVGELPDDDDLRCLVRVERQHAIVVLEEDNRLFADLAGRLLVLRRVAASLLALLWPEELRLRHRPQRMQRHFVKHRFRHFALAHCVGEWERLGLGVREVTDVLAAVHLDATAVQRALHGCVRPAPVRDDHPREMPAVAQDAALEKSILAAPVSVHLVVRRHHAPGACVHDGGLEGGEIDFVQRPFVADGVDVVSVEFLVVEAKVLDGRGNAVALDRPDLGNDQLCREARILGEVFPVAAATRITHDVDAGPEHLVFAARTRLFADDMAEGSGKVAVPSRRERGERRKDGRRISLARVVPRPALHVRADSVRRIGEYPFAVALRNGHRHRAAPACQHRLLLYRESGKNLPRLVKRRIV